MYYCFTYLIFKFLEFQVILGIVYKKNFFSQNKKKILSDTNRMLHELMTHVTISRVEENRQLDIYESRG